MSLLPKASGAFSQCSLSKRALHVLPRFSLDLSKPIAPASSDHVFLSAEKLKVRPSFPPPVSSLFLPSFLNVFLFLMIDPGPHLPAGCARQAQPTSQRYPSFPFSSFFSHFFFLELELTTSLSPPPLKGTNFESLRVLDTVLKSSADPALALTFNYASTALNNAFFLNGLVRPFFFKKIIFSLLFQPSKTNPPLRMHSETSRYPTTRIDPPPTHQVLWLLPPLPTDPLPHDL